MLSIDLREKVVEELAVNFIALPTLSPIETVRYINPRV
jgi:hypothetical protein